MVVTKPVALKFIGVNLKKPSPDVPVVAGQSFPRGVEALDLGWYEKALTVDALAECASDEELRAMRTKAVQYCELRAMQAMARGAG